MIGRVFGKGFSFKGPLLYAERGPLDSLNPDRVDWIYSRNLPTEDPETAARIMAATARGAHSSQAPVYHFAISFDPGDPVNREMMMQVADRTLAALRLDDHQVVIVAHRDRPHPHMHVVVNRVHPETCKVWSTWYDYPRIERSLREQELELGLRVTPGHLAKVPGSPELRPKPRLQRGDAEFLRDVTERAGPILKRADTWAELERDLAEEGLAIRVNHGGMCVTDGKSQVKASAVGREYSRKNLEKRFGALTDYRARISVVEIPVVAGGRKPAEKGLQNDSQEATPEQRPSLSSEPDRKVVVPPASEHGPVSRPSQAVPAPEPVRPPEPPRPIAPRPAPALSPREAALRAFYEELADLLCGSDGGVARVRAGCLRLGRGAGCPGLAGGSRAVRGAPARRSPRICPMGQRQRAGVREDP